MIITETDKLTDLYRKLIQEQEARLLTMRQKLEASQPELQTEKIRGRIEEIKQLLKALKSEPDAG